MLINGEVTSLLHQYNEAEAALLPLQNSEAHLQSLSQQVDNLTNDVSNRHHRLHQNQDNIKVLDARIYRNENPRFFHYFVCGRENKVKLLRQEVTEARQMEQDQTQQLQDTQLKLDQLSLEKTHAQQTVDTKRNIESKRDQLFDQVVDSQPISPNLQNLQLQVQQQESMITVEKSLAAALQSSVTLAKQGISLFEEAQTYLRQADNDNEEAIRINRQEKDRTIEYQEAQEKLQRMKYNNWNSSESGSNSSYECHNHDNGWSNNGPNEQRQADDGKWYKKEQFQEFFHSNWEWKWENAKKWETQSQDRRTFSDEQRSSSSDVDDRIRHAEREVERLRYEVETLKSREQDCIRRRDDTISRAINQSAIRAYQTMSSALFSSFPQAVRQRFPDLCEGIGTISYPRLESHEFQQHSIFADVIFGQNNMEQYHNYKSESTLSKSNNLQIIQQCLQLSSNQLGLLITVNSSLATTVQQLEGGLMSIQQNIALERRAIFQGLRQAAGLNLSSLGEPKIPEGCIVLGGDIGLIGGA